MDFEEVEHQSGFANVNKDTIPKLRHPWRRYFARHLDFAFYELLWMAFLYIVIGIHPIQNNFVQFLNIFMVFMLMLIIEPVLLSVFGTTLGKWILGLSISDSKGYRLSYSSALSRTWTVFARGEGYNIPIYNIYRNYKSYKACDEGSELPWDDGFVYTIRDTKFYRILVLVFAFVLIVSIDVFMMLQAEMPKNRGDISASEFAENFNDYMDYFNVDNGKYLSEDGSWVEKPNNGTVYIDTSINELPGFDITEKDGVVTRVSFEAETSENTVIWGYDTLIFIAEMSYVTAQQDMNCIKLHTDNILSKFKQSTFENYSFKTAGIEVSNEVEFKGYQQNSCSGTLFYVGDSERYFHSVFTMEKLSDKADFE